MKPKRTKWRVILGYIGFFMVIAATVTVAMLIYSSITDLETQSIALIMFAVIIVLSAICTGIDVIRRKFTVDAPVNKILDATERYAKGDFTLRLDITHTLSQYDEFDYIMENLNKMAAELSQNEVLKNDFISNVSHEIKTPIAVIQSYATLLQSDRLSADERKKYTKTLLEASARLTDLVMNILKLNKLENQQLTTDYVPVKLDEMLTQAIFGVDEIIEQKGLQLDCDIDEVTVNTVPSYLETVWNNLLSNAVKFTPNGGNITVSLKKIENTAVVKIADTGCGISAENGKHIFEKFYQGDTSHSNEGNGLGLALVKKVIDILGGTIAVESELNKGSVFTVVLQGALDETQK